MNPACPCSDCQDFRFNGSPNTALCHPAGCRCEVPAPIRSPFRRILRNELRLRRYSDPTIARANITAALILMREHERAGMPWKPERDFERAVWFEARSILMAQRPPITAKPMRPAPSGPCPRCIDGVIYHSNAIQGEYETPCNCSHGMSDSHYA